jgi:hypothetical protein
MPPKTKAADASTSEHPVNKKQHVQSIEDRVAEIISAPTFTEESISSLIKFFTSLEDETARKAILPLVKYDSWVNLNPLQRQSLFEQQPKLESQMNKGLKSYDSNEKNLRFFQINFVSRFVDFAIANAGTRIGEICADLSVILLSQLPTRRVVRPFFLERMHGEKCPNYPFVAHYISFPINDFTAEELTASQQAELLESLRDRVRGVCWAAGLEEIGLSSSAQLFGSQTKCDQFIDSLDPEIVKKILAEVLFVDHGIVGSDDSLVKRVFFNRLVERRASDSPIPMGNLFLSVKDFLARQHALYVLESDSIVQTAVEDVVGRLGATLTGQARMGLKIDKFEVQKISRNLVTGPIFVGEITVSLAKTVEAVKAEWDCMRSGDAVILVQTDTDGSAKKIHQASLSEIRDMTGTVSGRGELVGERRILTVELDNALDEDAQFEIAVRVKDSHFRHMLVNLSRKEMPEIPEFISDIVLGFGDPESASPQIDDSVVGDQERAIASGIQEGLTIISGGPGTGKTHVLCEIVKNLIEKERILVIGKSNEVLNTLLVRLRNHVPKEYVVKPAGSSEDEFSRQHVINHVLQRRLELLAQVRLLAVNLGLSQTADDFAYSCDNARQMWMNVVLPAWNRYQTMVKAIQEGREKPEEVVAYKLKELCHRLRFDKSLDAKGLLETMSVEEILYPFRAEDGTKINIEFIAKIFEKLNEVKPFEILRSVKERSEFLLSTQAKLVAITSTALCNHFEEFVSSKAMFTTVIFEDASQIIDAESFFGLIAQQDPNRCLKRVILAGDSLQLPPVLTRRDLKAVSMFERLVKLGVPVCQLQANRRNPAIAKAWSPEHEGEIINEIQFINVTETDEIQPMLHFYQNLGEAEFIVGLFMFLRLQGVNRERITILASYNGQKMLISDVLKAKCASNPLFGEPATVTTIDQYQGQECDVVLVSLVRTENPGHNADPRRLIAALSRARKAVYVFGRLNVYAEPGSGVSSMVNRMTRNGTQLRLFHNDNEVTVSGPNVMWSLLRDLMTNEIVRS